MYMYMYMKFLNLILEVLKLGPGAFQCSARLDPDRFIQLKERRETWMACSIQRQKEQSENVGNLEIISEMRVMLNWVSEISNLYHPRITVFSCWGLYTI